MSEHPRSLADGETGRGGVNTVHRWGQSVIRPIGPWTPAVHALLNHLKDEGFPYSPRVLGIDPIAGTETLSYIEGEVAMHPWPDCLRSLDGIAQIGRMLRQYHHAAASFRPQPDTIWRVPDVAWEAGLIIRHGDLGPWNMVWDGGQLVGFIDWDFAEPGLAIDDVAQAAWYAVPLRPDPRCDQAGIHPLDRAQRLTALCQAYGVKEGSVLGALASLQRLELARTRQLGRAGLAPWASFLARGDIEEFTEEIQWLQSYRG